LKSRLISSGKGKLILENDFEGLSMSEGRRDAVTSKRDRSLGFKYLIRSG